MKALITGASSGIGRDIARYLSELGYNLIVVARNFEKLNELKQELKTDVEIISLDLSDEKACFRLYEQVKEQKIDILINNAGFGVFGPFDESDIHKELNMIDINIKAVHILTKLFLKDFKKRNYGYILNVSSAAAFFPGPLMSSYYASKSYIFRLTLAIHEELRREKSNVYIGVLCPGPVNTNFNNRAGVTFNLKGLSSETVAKYAIREMFKDKLIIIPGNMIKTGYILSKFSSVKLLLKISYHIQKRKDK